MLRGICFETSDMKTEIINKIFLSLNIDIYKWKVNNYQAWKADSRFELFEMETYSGKEIRRIISEPSGLILILSMLAFNGEISEIKTYNDFQKSNCILAVLLTDANYVDIYCKDINLLTQIEKNVRSFPGFSNIDYITDENDQRTSFILF